MFLIRRFKRCDKVKIRTNSPKCKANIVFLILRSCSKCYVLLGIRAYSWSVVHMTGTNCKMCLSSQNQFLSPMPWPTWSALVTTITAIYRGSRASRALITRCASWGPIKLPCRTLNTSRGSSSSTVASCHALYTCRSSWWRSFKKSLYYAKSGTTILIMHEWSGIEDVPICWQTINLMYGILLHKISRMNPLLTVSYGLTCVSLILTGWTRLARFQTTSRDSSRSTAVLTVGWGVWANVNGRLGVWTRLTRGGPSFRLEGP